MNIRHVTLALAAALTLTAACKPSAETRDDELPTEDVKATEDTTPPARDTLLTGESVGGYGFAGDYELVFEGEFYAVDIAPGVSGTALEEDGELCEIWITSPIYKTATGLGIGSKIGAFGTPDVDLFIEEATGMIYSQREDMVLMPDKIIMDGPGEKVDPDALVTEIRLGGCGE